MTDNERKEHVKQNIELLLKRKSDLKYWKSVDFHIISTPIIEKDEEGGGGKE